ncbi:hypothetical protein [Methylomonas methanica]|uniref:SMODS and SLOG-associating 2TM effector domain-containing protein n=1 Tax=Methylomonas methanica (strain DSM 25384 / MC09) TaxID=857087 RepID=G0A4U5_METMM|nr:hypothetical protein [Methylomonas methanica]AEG02836.1 hypothetical protein Metme_4496 [Methylomonas methanica MC09]
MSESLEKMKDEVKKLEVKADQSCSIHASLRDKYNTYAKALDYFLLVATTYLLGLTLVEPAIGVPMSFGFDRVLFITLSSIIAFFLSIVQFKSDWKSTAEAHHQSFQKYANVKAECRAITSGSVEVSELAYHRIRDNYNTVPDIGTHIPEGAFLNGKKKHKKKVFISKYLDNHPGAWIWLIKLKLALKDNFGIKFLEH